MIKDSAAIIINEASTVVKKKEIEDIIKRLDSIENRSNPSNTSQDVQPKPITKEAVEDIIKSNVMEFVSKEVSKDVLKNAWQQAKSALPLPYQQLQDGLSRSASNLSYAASAAPPASYAAATASNMSSAAAAASSNMSYADVAANCPPNVTIPPSTASSGPSFNKSSKHLSEDEAKTILDLKLARRTIGISPLTTDMIRDSYEGDLRIDDIRDMELITGNSFQKARMDAAYQFLIREFDFEMSDIRIHSVTASRTLSSKIFWISTAESSVRAIYTKAAQMRNRLVLSSTCSSLHLSMSRRHCWRAS